MTQNLKTDSDRESLLQVRPGEAHLLEMTASKICHDIISPLGAILNGLELMSETGSVSENKEIIDLIAFSARQASAKLRMLRLAYGTGGADSSIKPSEVYNTFADYIGEENKIRQEWNSKTDLGISLPRKGYAKILAACLLLATETLPKGGEIKVSADENETTLIEALGKNAGFREGFIEALHHKTQRTDLQPQFVHAYVTSLYAAYYGFRITASQKSPETVNFRISTT